MKIKITAGFCAMLCLLGWLDLSFCGCFLAAMAVHELGHLAVLRACRIPVQSVRLSLCGAVIETGCMRYGQELLCAVFGPLAGALLGLCALWRMPKLAVVSLGLSVLNILPLYPLDGGRILRAVLLMLLPPDRAERIVHWVTVGTCSSLMLLACWGTAALQMGLWPIFAALILLWRAGGKEKQLLFSGPADKMRIQQE